MHIGSVPGPNKERRLGAGSHTFLDAGGGLSRLDSAQLPLGKDGLIHSLPATGEGRIVCFFFLLCTMKQSLAGKRDRKRCLCLRKDR